jgi:hypothetical protein
MYAIAIIAALLIMIPAAMAGIISGLAQCLSHQPDLTIVAEHASALLTALGPFGTGLLLIVSSLLAFVVLTLTALTLLRPSS